MLEPIHIEHSTEACAIESEMELKHVLTFKHVFNCFAEQGWFSESGPKSLVTCPRSKSESVGKMGIEP